MNTNSARASIRARLDDRDGAARITSK